MRNFESILYELVGANIKARREELKIHQSDLGLKAGVGRTSITNIEQGRQKPPLYVIYKICAVLNTEVRILLPTQSQIEKRLNSSENVDFTNLLEDLDVDKKTLREISSKIKQPNK